jgi:hypothetical protein
VSKDQQKNTVIPGLRRFSAAGPSGKSFCAAFSKKRPLS